jgi:hypothetical protein
VIAERLRDAAARFRARPHEIISKKKNCNRGSRADRGGQAVRMSAVHLYSPWNGVFEAWMARCLRPGAALLVDGRHGDGGASVANRSQPCVSAVPLPPGLDLLTLPAGRGRQPEPDQPAEWPRPVGQQNRLPPPLGRVLIKSRL